MLAAKLIGLYYFGSWLLYLTRKLQRIHRR